MVLSDDVESVAVLDYDGFVVLFVVLAYESRLGHDPRAGWVPHVIFSCFHSYHL